MEGSPARGQKLDGLAALLIHLCAASTVEELQSRLVTGISAQLVHGSAIVILENPETGELDFDRLKNSEGTAAVISPSWLKSHLDRHPELPRKLVQGEMVGITHLEGSTTPQPAAATRRNVLLLPVSIESRLAGI